MERGLCREGERLRAQNGARNGLFRRRRRVSGMSRTHETTAFQFSRAGALEPNPTLMRQRASAGLASTPDGTTFIALREGARLQHYVVLPGTVSLAGGAMELAKAVAARAEEVEAPDLSVVGAVATMQYERGSIAGSNSLLNADIQAVVDVAATSLRDGEWIAFSVRRPTRGETKANRRWVEARGTATHHSLDVSAVVTSLWVGGVDKAAASGVLRRIAGALPGFDLRVEVKSVTRTAATAAAALVAALLAAASVGAGVVPFEVPYGWVGWVLAAVAAVVAAGLGLGRLPSRATAARAAMRSGLVPPPPRRAFAPARPSRERMNQDGTVTPASPGDYPLAPNSFMVGAIVPLSVVAPHAGAESGAQETQSRVAPPALREPIGPLLGSNADAPVYLSEADDWQGFLALGEAGSGKSALLQAMWGYDAARKAGLLSSPGGRGAFNAMVAFDTKGDAKSADEYVAWSQAAGDRVVRIDFADAAAETGIELFPAHGDPVTRARRVVNALRYVFGEQSIGAESFTTLTRVFVGAFSVTDTVADEAGVERGRSPFYYANLLLLSRGDDVGVRLAQAIRTAGDRDGDADAVTATEMLSALYDPQRTSAQRAALVKAPQNKLEQLLAAEHWWSRPRRASWRSLLEHNASVVINLGIANGQLADEELREQVAAMMMYTLHEEIKSSCVGWFEAGKLVSIYADEVKHIAGNNARVVSWIRNDARSFGARAVFATQFPQQLEPEVRSTAMGFGTLVCFAQREARVISEILASLAVDGSSWTPADISGLPRFTAIVRTTLQGSGLTPFTVQVPDFESMRGSEFIAAQGNPPASGQVASAQVPHSGHSISFATVERAEP